MRQLDESESWTVARSTCHRAICGPLLVTYAWIGRTSIDVQRLLQHRLRTAHTSRCVRSVALYPRRALCSGRAMAGGQLAEAETRALDPDRCLCKRPRGVRVMWVPFDRTVASQFDCSIGSPSEASQRCRMPAHGFNYEAFRQIFLPGALRRDCFGSPAFVTSGQGLVTNSLNHLACCATPVASTNA